MHKTSSSLIKPITITILLFDEFSNLCLANAVEPLRAVNRYSGTQIYQWEFTTLNNKPVYSSSGLKVSPTNVLELHRPRERCYVISSYGHEGFEDKQTHHALQNLKKSCVQMVGFDTGAWLLASSGLLNQREATIHWDILESFEERFLSVFVKKTPYIATSDMLTCGGAMTTFDLTLKLIEMDCGTMMMLDVASLFLPRTEDAIPPSSKSQGSTLITRAISLMHHHIETPLVLSALCEKLGCAPKTLERRFTGELKMSPGQFYRHLRLKSARSLIENTALSIAEIALRSGYKNASAMSRAFATEFGQSPSSMRK